MKTIKEVNELTVNNDFDIIIVGAGIAGVSAALAAGRTGKNVLLIEKGIIPGGLATLGMIAYYLPLCDGKGHKLIGGIAEELLHASIKYGYNTLPDGWNYGNEEGPEAPDRYATKFSPPEFIMAMDELLEEAGVKVLYDTIFCDCIVKNSSCQYIIVENKSGRQALQAKVVIDTTGDADVMYRAGVTCEEQDNYLSFWFYDTNLSLMQKAIRKNDVKCGINLRTIGTNTGQGITDKSEKYLGTDGEQVSQFIIETRKLARNLLKDRENKEDSFLAFPGMPQFRTTRRIKGKYTLTRADESNSFDDAIGCVGDWRKAGPVYEIPYRTLISSDINNIITAGRTISAKGDSWEVTRVIPAAAMTGHAAGKAAVMAVENNCSLHDISLNNLQRQLSEEGLILHKEKNNLSGGFHK